MGNNPQPPQPIKTIQQPEQTKSSPEKKLPKKQPINSNGSKMRQSGIKTVKKNSLNTSNNDQKQKIPEFKKPQQGKEKIKQSEKQSSLNNQPSTTLKLQLDLMNDKIFIEFLFQKVLDKNKSFSAQLSKQIFQLTILSSLDQSKLKFKTKLKKSQIYPIFTSNQSKTFQKDVLAFEIALKNNIYLACDPDISSNNLFSQKGQASIQNRLRNFIEQTANMIMAELMGKTNIWRSLMISKQQQRKRIIEMFKSSGIDDKTLQLLY